MSGGSNWAVTNSTDSRETSQIKKCYLMEPSRMNGDLSSEIEEERIIEQEK